MEMNEKDAEKGPDEPENGAAGKSNFVKRIKAEAKVGWLTLTVKQRRSEKF